MIDITRSELEFLREAVNEKHANLMKVLVFKEDSLEQNKLINFVAPAPINLTRNVSGASKVRVSRKPKAPWGYKKDGTPKARPGRKA
jgi:hypothetical protein